jgi:chromosome segregation ATPase
MRTGAYRSRQERVASQAAALDNSGFTAMAPRRAAKARSKPAPAAARPARGKAASNKQAAAAANGSLRERLAAVEGERDALKEELERFKARQRRLEETQAQVRDRISWALDSLQNILDGKG